MPPDVGQRDLHPREGREDVTYHRDPPGSRLPDLETLREERLRALAKAREKGVECPSFWVNR